MRKVKGRQRILVILICLSFVLQGLPLEGLAAEVDSVAETAKDLAQREVESSEIVSWTEIDAEVQGVGNSTEMGEQEDSFKAEEIVEAEKSSEEKEVVESEISNSDVEAESENGEIISEEAVLQEGEVLSGQCGDNLTWKIENGTLTISGTGDMWDYKTCIYVNVNLNSVTDATWGKYISNLDRLVIEKGITSIGCNAFYGCDSFSGDLELPDTVTYIGDNAFHGCSDFTGTLNLPDTITYIGEYAFENCSGFKGKLKLSNKITSIKQGTFRGCSGFNGELKIPSNVTNIEGELVGAFEDCSGFSGDLIIPNSVTSIGSGAFCGCSGFDGDLVIPNSVTSIGNRAFEGCSGFSGDLVIPNNVTEIGDSAFAHCEGLNGRLVISDNITSIKEDTFAYCSFGGELKIPNNIISIGNNAFFCCGGFSGDLIIPDSVISVGKGAFWGCIGFDGRLIISDSITSIEDSTFRDCEGLSGDLIIPNHTIYIGESAFSNCGGFSGDLIIPNSVDYVGDGAFFGCFGLNGQLVIPDSITDIKSETFGCCHFSGKLIIPDSVTSIGIDAFFGCDFDGELKIPNSVKNIGEGAFRECENFTIGIIPSSISLIEDRTFEYCLGLTDIYILETVIEIKGNPFWEYHSNSNLSVTIHCPKDSYAYNWAVENGFNVVDWDGITIGGDTPTPPPSDDTITGQCGDNLTWTLKNDKDNYILTISGTGNMYDYALETNTSTAPWIAHIKSKPITLNIEEGVTSIGKYAFYNCEKINENVIIPNSITSIGDNAFYNCTGMADIYIHDTLTQIGGNPFRYFNALIGTFKNMELTFHCIKDSYAYKWAEDNGFTVEEWDGITIDIKKRDITINGRGYAYARFLLTDNRGQVQKNATISYSFGGRSYTANSDSDGYVQIRSELITDNKDIKKQIKTTEIILDPNGKKEKLNSRVVMAVKVMPFTYTQTWKLGVSGSVKVGVAEALGLELGPAEVEASLGGANITGSKKGTVSIQQKIVGNKKNIELTQNLNNKVGLNASVGPEAKAKAATKGLSVETVSVSGDATVGYGTSIGLKIDNYDPANFNQNLEIGKFVIAMAAHQMGSSFWVKVVDTMGLDVYNVSDVSVGLMVKGGANVGSIKYGDKNIGTLANSEGSISCTYADGKNEVDKSLTKETKTVFSTKGGFMNTGLGNRTKIFSSNLKGGYTAKIFEDYEHNPQKMQLSVDTSQTGGTLFKDTTQTEKLSVEFDSVETKKILNNVSKLKNFYMGISSFILDGAEMFRQVEGTDATGQYNCSTISTTGSDYSFSIGGKAGLDIGLKLGLEGAYDLGYTTESGEYKSGSVTKTAETSNVSDLLGETSMLDVTNFFTDPVEAALDSAQNFIVDLWDDFKNGVENAYAKVESTIGGALDDIGNWAVHIIALSPTKNRTVTSYSVMAVQPMSEGEPEEKIVYTVGDAYIVYVTNEKEERVNDFSKHPLNLTLEYTDDMLLAAGLSKENTDHIAIYKYEEDICGYFCLGGIVDAQNNKVTVEITTSGEYILATDTTAPIVTAVAVTENTKTPVISVDFDELSGFKEFSFKLDDVEVIGTVDWKSHYNYALNRISYQVVNELAEGVHKISVYAVDSADNAMIEPFEFEFYIGNMLDYGDIFLEDIPTDGVIPKGLWIAGIADQSYTGKAIKPQIRVYDYNKLLTEKKDYTISYKNNVKVNDAQTAKTAPTITVTGKGNYTGKETAVFQILPKDISDEDIEIDDITLSYNKKIQKPTPVISWNGKKLKAKTDFLVQYTDSFPQAYQGVGSYKILVSGTGNFSGQRELEVTITDKKLITKMKVGKIANQSYTGKEIKPEITVKDGKTLLKQGTDYTLEFCDNTNIGKACVTIVGMGDYSGKKQIFFNITGGSVAKAKVEGLNKKVPYTGSAITQNCKLTIMLNGSTKTLKKDTDYTVSYVNNIHAGKATVVFKGINGFSGMLKQTFMIEAFDISDQTNSRYKITLPKTAPYAKGGSTPKPVITFREKTLCEGVDYTLRYKNNKEITDNAVGGKKTQAKIPQVVIKGKGNYKGTRSLDFQISTQDISNLTLNAADKTYQSKSGSYITKVEVVDVDGKKLSAGKDYDKNLTYTYAADTYLSDTVVRKAESAVEKNDVIPAGTVIRVSAVAKGSYKGTISGTYRITKSDISKASVKVADQIYTGNPIEPDKTDLTVKLGGKKVDNDCYEIVKYDRNVSKGKATLTIKGIGDYGGVKTVPFTIRSKGFLWWWKK